MADEFLFQELAVPSREKGYLGVQANPDSTVKSRGGSKGLGIYDELRRDTRARSVLEKREMGVTSREWQVLPASERRVDIKAAELVREELARVPFDDVCGSLLDGINKGFAVAEIIWEQSGERVQVRAIKGRHQSQFTFGSGDQLQLMVEGRPVAMPDRKFIVFRNPAPDGNPYGDALGSSLFWPVLFKKQGILAWIDYLEKAAQPLPVGAYPPNTTEEEQDRLLEMLSAARTRKALIHPQGWEINLLESARAGGGDVFEAFVRYMDEQIAEASLGETLTTNVGSSGSRAAAQTHDDIRKEKARRDSDRLSAVLNATLCTWLTEFNVPGATPPQVWRVFTEPEDLDALSQRDERLHNMGWEPSEEYITSTYGDGWSRVPPGAESSPPNPQPQFAEPTEATDPVKPLLAQLSERAATPVNALIVQLRDLVGQVASLEELQDRLLEVYGGAHLHELAHVLELGALTAHLTGRAGVLDGD